ARQPVRLRDPGVDEVIGVGLGTGPGPLGVVRLLLIRLARDAVILEAGVNALAGRGQVGAHVLVVEVEADVAIEIAIPEVARIAFLGAPHLLGAVGVATEGGHAGVARDRRVHAVDRAGTGMRDAVGVDEEVAESGARELGIEAGFVGAFGQPEAVGRAAEKAAVLGRRHLHLGAYGGRIHRQQREKTVRRRAGDAVDQDELLDGPEGGDVYVLPLVV